MTSICAVTCPDIDETPTMLKARLLLSGVKTTLNSVAVKRELSWQGLSDFDSINRSADASGKREVSAAKQSHAGFDNDEKSIVLCLTLGVVGPHGDYLEVHRRCSRPDCAVAQSVEPALSADDILLRSYASHDDPKICRNAEVVDGKDGGERRPVAATTKIRIKEIRTSGDTERGISVDEVSDA